MKLDFIVVGAPKCGTTSLHHYLKQNSKIFLTEQKELHYFSADMRLSNDKGPGDKAALSTVVQTVEEYTAYFAECKNWQVAGDISPSYFHFGKRCAENIRDWTPNVKIIVILRNPIEKAYSQYMHQVQHGVETLSFKKALDAEPHRKKDGWRDMWMYTGSTFYSSNLRDYLEVFGTERVHVVFFEEFIRDKKGCLDGLARFIGVDPCEWDVSKHYNKSKIPKNKRLQQLIVKPPAFMVKPVRTIIGKKLVGQLKKRLDEYNTKPKPEIEPEDRKCLRTLFLDDVRELENLLGHRTPWDEFYK